jgi:hypothetical protein
VPEHQVGAVAAAGVPRGGGDEAVEQAGVFDLVAAAERFDDALDMASALSDVLDEVEVLVAADLLTRTNMVGVLAQARTP